jgi:cell division protein ZapA (FtsZ GTPase activity inhibitor)
MNEVQSELPRIELEVYGLTFRLRAPAEDHDRIRRAARHVENVMRELVVSQTSPDTSRLALQAALIISMDYFKAVEEEVNRNGATNESNRRVDELLQRIEDSLRAL